MIQARAFQVGHPVDVARGTVHTSQNDAVVPGRLEIVWDRHYSTGALAFNPGPLGRGWTNSFLCRLTVSSTQYHFFGPEGYRTSFDSDPARLQGGSAITDFGTFQELRLRGVQAVVTRWSTDSGNIERFVFTPDGPSRYRLTAIEDIVGRPIDLFYDDSARLAAIVQRREGRSLVLHYSSQGLIEKVHLVTANGESRLVATYDYDVQGRLVRAVDALGCADEFTYDDQSRLTLESNRNGGRFRFEYDPLGRCTRTWGIDGFDEKRLRYSDIGITEVTNSKGGKTIFQWNEAGQVVTEISPLGSVKRRSFDEYGRIIEFTDAAQNSWRYGFDESGNPSTFTNPLGRTRAFTFNDRHQSSEFTDEGGNLWTGQYDARGFLISTKDAVGRVWNYDYDEAGDLVTIRGPEGYVIRFVYDSDGNNISLADNRNGITKFTWDQEGRMVSRINAVGSRTTYTYDSIGQVIAITHGDGSSVTVKYHPSGKISEYKNEVNQAIYFRYGTCGRILERIDAAGNQTRYSWGLEPGELLLIENERGEACRFDYDADNRIIREQLFDGRVREFRYSASSEISAVVTARGQTTFERDALARIARRVRADGEEESYAYDDRGYLIEARTGDSIVTFEYDAVGRVTRESRDGMVVSHTYGPWGRTRRTSPWGNAIEFEWNLEYVRRVRLNGRAEIGWEADAVGRIERRSFTNGLTEAYQHDIRGRIIRQELMGRGRSALSSSSYRYDPAGHPSRVSYAGSELAQVQYDPLHHVVSFGAGHHSEEFALDATGNISQWRHNGVERRFEYGRGNRLAAWSTGDGERTTFEYDAEGNLTGKSTQTKGGLATFRFEYDSANRLVAADTPNSGRVEFRYDALGRRISKRTRLGETGFFWDGFMLLAEFGPNSGTDRTQPIEYYSSNYTPIAAMRGGNSFFYHCDLIGAPLEVRDERGAVVWTGERRVYSLKRRGETDTFENPWRLPGQYEDVETGLYYNGFRHYDPDTARYVSQDPLGLEGGFNLYSYVSNPLAYADPLGLQPPGPTPGGNTLPPYDGGKTQGFLVRPDGRETPLTSGYDGPSKGTSGIPGMNGNIKSHVEAHAAAIMRDEKLDEATLYINRQPCPTKDPRSPGCDEALPKMLPPGAKLKVVGPDGFEKTYEGTPDPPPRPPRKKKQTSC